MYLDNKYTRWYNAIIANAKTRDTKGYVEKHHILPESLGGNNNRENLVKLTAKEHFICHLLLTKMVTGNSKRKMIHAAWAMLNLHNTHQPRYTSRSYQIVKKERAIALSRHFSFENPMFNEEAKAKHKAKMTTRSTFSMTGRKHTVETIEKMKLARANQIISSETKAKISSSLSGKNHSLDTRTKMSLSQRGKKRTKKECPHCGKLAAGPCYTRWHGDNCKLRTRDERPGSS